MYFCNVRKKPTNFYYIILVGMYFCHVSDSVLISVTITVSITVTNVFDKINFRNLTTNVAV